MRTIILMLLLCLQGIGAMAQPGKKPEPPPPAEFGVLGGTNTAKPKKIKPAFYTPATLTFEAPLLMREVLQALYPGDYYDIPDRKSVKDTFRLVEWNCPGCPAKLLSGWIVGEKLRFPLVDDNQTRWKDSVYFTDDSGHRNVFISFSTTANQEREDFIPSGRFACAFMGLAWLKMREDKWVLQAFSPGVGCYGAFQTLPEIKVVQLGKGNYGCMLANTNGGAGGPYMGDLHVFAPIKKQFSTVLTVENVRCMNAGVSKWDFNIRAIDMNSHFSDMRLDIKGSYRKADFEVWATPRATPQEIKASLATRDSMEFTITRTYRYGKDRRGKEKYGQVASECSIQE